MACQGNYLILKLYKYVNGILMGVYLLPGRPAHAHKMHEKETNDAV